MQTHPGWVSGGSRLELNDRIGEGVNESDYFLIKEEKKM